MPKFPGYHLVPASLWVNLHPSKQELLRKAGGFPVNDSFMRIWERPDTRALELLLLMGGYGSSKTTDRIAELVLSSMTQPYFRCYFGRAVFETAKKELHSNIVTVIKDMGFEHLFDFSEKPNGTKEISCIATGNRFRPFGCDDTDTLKGIDNPTHIFIDELDQVEFEAFGMLLTRLRSKKGNKCFVGCFNTCDVFEDHWLRTTLLNKDNPIKDIRGDEIKLNIIEHFSTYKDNHFIDVEEYMQSMSIQAKGNPIKLEAIVNGAWGSNTTGQPFYKNFEHHSHVGKTAYNPSLALHVSFDENVNPYLPVGIFQCSGTNVYMIDEIAAVNPKNTLRWVCGEIIRRYGPLGVDHKAGLYIYGDATSQKDDVKVEKGKNMFTLVKEYLEPFKPKLRTSKANPNVAMRGNFMNEVFWSRYGGLNIVIGQQCNHMIADLVNTAEAPDGSKDKTKEQVNGVRGVQRWGHFTDLLDYFICEAYMTIYLRYQRGGKPSKWVEGSRKPHNVI
jgi:hypothetical protein